MPFYLGIIVVYWNVSLGRGSWVIGAHNSCSVTLLSACQEQWDWQASAIPARRRQTGARACEELTLLGHLGWVWVPLSSATSTAWFPAWPFFCVGIKPATSLMLWLSSAWQSLFCSKQHLVCIAGVGAVAGDYEMVVTASVRSHSWWVSIPTRHYW